MQSPDLTWYALHFVNLLMPYAAVAAGIALISVTPLGRAAISWLKGHVNRGRGAELASELERLRLDLTETQERLDFVERRLLNGPSPAPGPRASAEPVHDSRIPTPV